MNHSFCRVQLKYIDQNIPLSKQELGEFGETAGLVELAEGSGYYATLAAYHPLHCKSIQHENTGAFQPTSQGIKRLHHFMYFEHYYSNRSDVDRTFIQQHTDWSINIFVRVPHTK